MERQGRVHTSTVTVAVLDADAATLIAPACRPEDLRERFTRGRGPGGQHKNKTDSCVVLTHLPSGITVTVDGRDQHANRRAARAELERRLAVREATTQRTQLRELRRGQIGSGERGDKVRTYREQDGRVTDHRTGRQAALGAVLRGDLSGLYD